MPIYLAPHDCVAVRRSNCFQAVARFPFSIDLTNLLRITACVVTLLISPFATQAAGPATQQKSEVPELEAGVDTNTGVLTHAIEIDVPPGPGGLEPGLALVYSSRARAGVAGFGWGLQADQIQCSERLGAPDHAACAHFEWNGELLVGGEVDGDGFERFHTLNESFVRIRRLPNNAWEVTSQDGMRRIYGPTSNSRTDHAEGTAVWHVAEIVDVFGNQVQYLYAEYDGYDYLSKVLYAGGTRRVEFRYEDRPEIVSMRTAGMRFILSKRLTEIQVISAGNLSHRLGLEYADAGIYSTDRSRLASVTRYGSDCLPRSQTAAEIGCNGLPPQRFEYTDMPPGETQQYVVDSTVEIPGNFLQMAVRSAIPNEWGLSYPDAYGVAWGDVNGDGLDDLIRADCYPPCVPSPGASYPGAHEVYLNHGNGWESTPDPDWSAALSALRYQAPSLKIVRLNEDFSIYPTTAAPYCAIEEGSFESGVYFGATSEYLVPPQPISVTPHPTLPEPWREFAAPGNFRVADVNGDGRVDFILSARVGSAWKKLAEPDCEEVLASAEHYAASIQVVFLNTGDPSDGGWRRASELGHPGLEEGLPPFMALEFQDHIKADDGCSSDGWQGNYDLSLYPAGSTDQVWSMGYCRSFLDFDAQFVELNGDGRLDLIVLETEDPRYLPENVRVRWGDGSERPDCPTTLTGSDNLNDGQHVIPEPALVFGGIACQNPARSKAYVQVEQLGGGFAWAPAPEFDLGSAPEGAPEHHSYLYFLRLSWDAYREVHHPSSKDGGFHVADVGVRLIDLNGDGLTDVLWRDPFLDSDSSAFDASQLANDPASGFWNHEGGPSIAEGVLINTGAGWCASWSDCPEAARYSLPMPLVSAETAEFQDTRAKYVSGALLTFDNGANFVDVNGDGLVDLVRTVENQKATWLQSPGSSGGTVWQADERYLVPPLAKTPIHLNSDGVVDWILSDSARPYAVTFATSSTNLPDLLERIENGRGAATEFEYVRDASQIDASIEALAAAGNADLHGPSTDAQNVTRWMGVPVVSSRTLSGPNLLDTNGDSAPLRTAYRYARPRWDEDYRLEHGFGFVEESLPGGATIQRTYHQSLGATGRQARETLFTSDGAIRRTQISEWEIATGVPGASDAAFVGRPVRMEERNEYGALAGDVVGAIRSLTYDYGGDDSQWPEHGFNFVREIVEERPSGGTRTERIPQSGADLTHWVTGLLAMETERSQTGTLLGQRAYTYHVTDDGVMSPLVARIESLDQPRTEMSALPSAAYHVVESEFDTYGNLRNRIVDPDGLPEETTYCYDGDAGCALGHGSHAFVVQETDALGKVTEFVPHPIFASPAVIWSEYQDEPSTTYTYDVFGRELERRMARGGVAPNSELAVLASVTSYVNHDGESPRTTITRFADAESLDFVSETRVGDGFGGIWKRIQSQPSPLGIAYIGTATARDGLTRTQFETLPQSCGTDAACSGLLGIESPRRVRSRDELGRLTRSVESDGSFLLAEYTDGILGGDAPLPQLGQSVDLVSTKDTRGGLSVAYLDGDRVVRIDECETLINAQSPVVESCSSAGIPSVFSYEATGERSSIFDAVASGAADFSDYGEHVLHFEYDTLGRVVATHDPDKDGIVTTTYDVRGRIHEVVNARSQKRTYFYDRLGRMTYVGTPSEEADVTIGYRRNQKQRDREFSLGRYWNGFAYDEFGRLRRTETGVRGSMETRYKYDLLGRRTRIVHPIAHSGERTTIAYEYQGPLLRRVCDLGSADTCADAPQLYLDELEYDGLGSLTQVAMAGGTRSFEYDATTRVLTRDAFASGAGGAFWIERLMRDENQSPLYDEAGNLLEVRGSSSAADFDFSTRHEFDGLGRLASWERVGHGVALPFEYDALGNMTRNAGREQVYSDESRPHAIQSMDGGGGYYSYDADGNLAASMVAGAIRFFTFDSANRMVCVGSSSGGCEILQVVYDLAGQRIKEILPNGGLRRYVGEDFVYTAGTLSSRESIISIRVNRGRVATKRVVGGEIASMIPGTTLWLPTRDVLTVSMYTLLFLVGLVWLAAMCAQSSSPIFQRLGITLAMLVALQWMGPGVVHAYGRHPLPGIAEHRWVLSDGVGSALVELDASGNRLGQVLLEPFGRLVDAVGALRSRNFAGHAHSAETGFHFMGARWQDPGTGAFLSLDPLVARSTDPQSYNPYAYARNNPISRVDRDGRADEGATGGWWGSINNFVSRIANAVRTVVQTTLSFVRSGVGSIVGAVGGVFSGMNVDAFAAHDASGGESLDPIRPTRKQREQMRNSRSPNLTSGTRGGLAVGIPGAAHSPAAPWSGASEKPISAALKTAAELAKPSIGVLAGVGSGWGKLSTQMQATAYAGFGVVSAVGAGAAVLKGGVLVVGAGGVVLGTVTTGGLVLLAGTFFAMSAVLFVAAGDMSY